MPGDGPLDPIFKRKKRYGTVNFGAMIGTTTIQATAPASVVTATATTIPPTSVTALFTICDDFNRANAADISNAGAFPWVEITPFQLSINTNKVFGNNSRSDAFWNVNLGNNHWIEVTTKGGSIYFRANNVTTSLAGKTFYEAFWSTAAGGTVTLRKQTGGVATSITSATGTGGTDPITLRAEIVGSSISVYVNGVVKISTTDSSFATGPYVGIRADDVANAIDNFCSGSL